MSELADLLAAAKVQSQRAYAPYSEFRVGAAVEDGRGRIHPGCNVENAAYGSTMCAERNAVFRAVSDGARSIRRLVLYTPTATHTYPCGACLQVLAELAPDATVVLECEGAGPVETSVGALIPHAFGEPSLGKGG